MNKKQIEKNIRHEYVNFFKKNPNPTDNQKKKLYERLLKKSQKFKIVNYEYFFLGNLELQKSNDSKAIKYFNKSIQISANNPFSYNSIGLIYQRNNKTEKAIEYFEKAIKCDGNLYFILYNLGRAFEKIGNIEKSKEYYEKVLKINKESQDAINGLQTIEDIYAERRKYYISKFNGIEGFFVFADIRGFTKWSKTNGSEIDKLFNIFYPLAIKYFGEILKDSKSPHKRVVKFLGDGFFAIQEYENVEVRTKILNLIIDNSKKFITNFNKLLQESKIIGKSKLGFGFGITYGKVLRFNFKGVLDWTGEKINYAARFCSVAEKNEIVLEEDFQDILPTNIEVKHTKKDIRNYGKIDILSIKV